MSSPSLDPIRFPDDDLPEGAVVDGERLTRDVKDVFDFIVVGSGAAGAVAAHTLVSAGHSVAIVEEGPWVKTREFGEDVHGALRRMLRDSAMQAIEGRSFLPLLQGRCVGGSTVINSAIAWRTPEDVLDDWAARFGLGKTLTMRELEPHFATLERDLHVQAVELDVLGNNNGLFLQHARTRNYQAGRMHRYDNGCRGSARCFNGCPTAAKRGMSVTYVPAALKRGARIFTSCRVDEVLCRFGRAVGIQGRSTSSDPWRATNRRITLTARKGVVLAASTVQTPVILQRSGVRAMALGEHFQIHPGLGLAGRFDTPIRMEFGATQGAESIHFRRSHRFKLETIALPPELVAARLPGAGAELTNRLADYGNIAIWAAQVRSQAQGTVRPAWGGGARVRLTLTDADMVATRTACTTIAELLFDAGAREIWPGIHGVPSVLTSRADIKLIAEGPLDPRAYSFIATHLFGAARMGPDPRSSAVGLNFAVHGTERLYVVDSSLFPTNLGVNPQHSIMAIARLAASRIAERASAGMAA
ncbi:GMC family oxidoreductase N-terminal domain-containing protein [Pendulispora albinea]|uniref:GMC family oxidoreductase n=1 Tax=Pendulispora albinea TaxID=2741071 RepID=A0ABZ2LJT1_9BACT